VITVTSGRLTVLGFNLLGDGLRDALDPGLRSKS
jgi:ABC-type dipeptide/oligopeptide/nickel transport system permease subunit